MNMSEVSVNNARIAKNTLFLYARMLFVMVVSIYTTRVVLNVLGVEDYGIYNVVCGFVSMFGFLNTSLSNGIQRFYNYEEANGGQDAAKRVFQTAFLIQFCLAALIFILVEGIGVWYINNKMVIPVDRLSTANWVFQFSVVSLVLVVFQIPYSAAILAHEKMDYYALVSIIDVLLKLTIILILPYFSGDCLIIYGLLQALASLLSFVLYVGYSKRNFRELIIEKVFYKDLFSSIFKFSGWNVMDTFAWMTQNQGVNMVINLFWGTVVNAARGIAGQIQVAISSFCSNLAIAFRPQLVQSYAEGNLIRTKKMMYSMSKIMFILFFALALPFCVEIDYVLYLWLGDNVPQHTASFTILLLASMIPRNFTMALSQVVHATGKLKKYEITTCFIVMLTLPLSYIALRTGCDVTSVYFIDLAVCVILFISCLFVFRTLFPLSILDYLKRVIVPCMILAIIAIPFSIAPTWLITKVSFLRLVIVVVFSITIVAVLSFVIILDKDERMLTINFIKRRDNSTKTSD